MAYAESDSSLDDCAVLPARDRFGAAGAKTRVGIMQPYFLPYIGYFQLMQACDTMVVYDNIKYTKKGWINRNRFLLNGSDAVFSIPLAHDSDSRDVRDRRLADSYEPDKLLRQLAGAYRRAPRFEFIFPVLEELLHHPERDLFGFLLNSIRRVAELLEIKTRLIVSSSVEIDHSLTCEDKVLALCNRLQAGTYINSIGGRHLYASDRFSDQGIELRFLKSRSVEYPQLGAPFVPFLSILDVLMFNPLEQVQGWVRTAYDLESPLLDLTVH